MRAAPAALVAFLAAQRAARDAPMLMADCYTFTLRTGTVLTYTNADVPVTLGSVTFAANSVLVDGLTYTCKAGLDVDQQQINLAARPTDTVGGVPVLIALHHGVFDGCEVQRERAFLTSWGSDADRQRHPVQGAHHLGRPDRPHLGADHGGIRPDAARPRHAAQPLSAHLRPHAVRLGLLAREERLRHQRHGRRQSDRADDPLERGGRRARAGHGAVHLRHQRRPVRPPPRA